MQRIIEVLQGLLREYERVCDLFVVTPTKHVGYRKAVELLEELAPAKQAGKKGEE